MLLVVAWDGACFDIVDPLIAEGKLPEIARLIDEGARREVASTVPAVTFPAWTTFATAASPARHGVTDFSVRSGYSLTFLNASHRRLPALWDVAGAAGKTAGVYALPVTYPPSRAADVMVCGFDTPLGAATLGARSHPAGLAGDLERRYGSTAVGGPSQASIDEGWHERALDRMIQTIELRTRICSDLLRERRFDCFVVHYGESDTVAHQFWHLCDPRSPRFVARGNGTGAIARVYEALDRGLGRLRQAAGAAATVMLVSDHGSGGTSNRAIFWNRWLTDHGYLRFAARPAAVRLAQGARRVALRAVPARWQASAFASLPRAAARVEAMSRLGSIDWRHTRAFSEELNYFPSIWLNLEGREPLGSVAPVAAEALVDSLRRDLAGFRDPFDGAPVVARVRRREEIADGPYAVQLPDLVLELRDPDGYGYASMSSRAGAERASMRRLAGIELSGARGTSMPGAHRPTGMCVLAGPRVRKGSYAPGVLADAGATAMALVGCAPDDRADGRAWSDCVTPCEAPRVPRGWRASVPPPRSYGHEDEAEIADRLRALGYLA